MATSGRTMASPKRSSSAGRSSSVGRLKGGENVAVAVRIRPMLSLQGEASFVCEPTAKAVLEIGDDDKIVNTWAFDHVFGPECSTQHIYTELGSSIIRRVMEGYNSTLFCYGQTASGKTHTLLGTVNEPGLILRSVRGMYDAIHEANFSTFLVRISYIEVYNEELRDLFSSDVSSSASGRLKIVEDPKTGPWVRNAVSSVVALAEQILGLLKFGEKQRSYGKTNMNEHSSRSHVLFRVLIKRRFMTGPNQDATKEIDDSDPSAPVRNSALNFVDLAGSERLKKTGATGQTLKEANAINTSLMTLGTVIAKLSVGDNALHIPYRDSKLTHLLSSSLGGNSLTTMVACISPGANDKEESNNTLRYATRASKIVNSAGMNEIENMETFVTKYQQEIAGLKTQLQVSIEKQEAREVEFRITQDDLERRVENSRIDFEALQEKLAQVQDAASSERDELLAELDLMHKKLDEERVAISAGAPGTVPKEIFEERETLQKQLQESEEKASKERRILQNQMESEAIRHKQRVEALQAEVAAVSKGDMSAVHGALRAENSALKTEIRHLAESNDTTEQGEQERGDSASSLSRMLVSSQRQLMEAQVEIETLRGDLMRAQESAVVQGQAMAEELNMLRKELRFFAASQIEHSNFDVPEGYVLWFHAHTIPRIFALGNAENSHLLLRPHPTAPIVARNLPLGVNIEVDPNAVAVALEANKALREQLERLVPSSLSSRGFWLNYFSHVHAIKAHVASQARARAVQWKGDDLDPQLCSTFCAVLQEGILIRRYSTSSPVRICKLWLSDFIDLSILADGESEPEVVPLKDILRLEVGKTTDAFKVEPGASSAIDELSFSLITHQSSICLEASARLERHALIEGFYMIIDLLQRGAAE